MSTITAVVPMYNEAAHIRATVAALLDQTRPLDEIIVVDNGSTDDSAAIVADIAAEHHSVRLLHEATPGCYAARNTGFDAARGEIIARTDADTLVDRGWAGAIETFFDSDEGRDYSAVTGPVLLYDAPPFAFIDRIARTVHSRGPIGAVHGPNLALRAGAWEKCRDTVTPRQDIWDDFDLSISLHDAGCRMFFLPEAEVATSARTVQRSPWANRQYLAAGLRAANARHHALARRAMILDLPVRSLLFTGMWLVLRPWDEETRTWRLRRLFQPLDNQHRDVTEGRP